MMNKLKLCADKNASKIIVISSNPSILESIHSILGQWVHHLFLLFHCRASQHPNSKKNVITQQVPHSNKQKKMLLQQNKKNQIL